MALQCYPKLAQRSQCCTLKKQDESLQRMLAFIWGALYSKNVHILHHIMTYQEIYHQFTEIKMDI